MSDNGNNGVDGPHSFESLAKGQDRLFEELRDFKQATNTRLDKLTIATAGMSIRNAAIEARLAALESPVVPESL